MYTLGRRGAAQGTMGATSGAPAPSGAAREGTTRTAGGAASTEAKSPQAAQPDADWTAASVNAFAATLARAQTRVSNEWRQ